jgi:hypothetical protein
VAWLGLALLIWPVSFALVAWIVETSRMLGYALLITVGSFLVASLYLSVRIWLITRRLRLERSGPHQ